MTNKFVVKLGLDLKSFSERVTFGRDVHTHMDGNSNFGTPSPTILELETATDNLEVALVAAQQGGTLLTEQLHVRVSEFDTLMTAMGNYVDGVARGNREIILSAGMEAKNESTPAPLPDRVSGLEVSLGPVSGSLDLDWDRMPFGRVYLVYMRADTDPVDDWTFLGNSFPSKYTVSSLTIGARYWFKVEAQGTAGKGEASDPASSLVI
jgi:hypothetical protein